MPADNTIYNKQAAGWWDEDNFLHLLKTGINPVRIEFFRNVMNQNHLDPTSLSVLDIGCGGGFLSEEFGRMGCTVTGMDLSTATLTTAFEHSHLEYLKINYLAASALVLPFPNHYFDVVVCCDVLEHLDNLDKAVKEAARVLNPGGLFLFDTINRTFQSYVETILVGQELPFTRFFAPGTHDWHQFIHPEDLLESCKNNNLLMQEIGGIQPGISKFNTALEIMRLKFGRINFAEFGRRLKFQQSSSLSGSYLGYAIKIE